jgi:hypothetical protein
VHFAKYFLATFPRIDPSSRDVPAALNHKIKKEWKKNSLQMSFKKMWLLFLQFFKPVYIFSMSYFLLVCSKPPSDSKTAVKNGVRIFISMLNYLKFYHTTTKPPSNKKLPYKMGSEFFISMLNYL